MDYGLEAGHGASVAEHHAAKRGAVDLSAARDLCAKPVYYGLKRRRTGPIESMHEPVGVYDPRAETGQDLRDGRFS